MFDFFKRKKQEEIVQKPQVTQQYQLPSYAKEYTLLSSNMVDYDLFSLCKKVPVSYKEDTTASFANCVLLPTDPVIMTYLHLLKYIKTESYKKITVFELGKGKNLYLLPPIKQLKYNIIVDFDDDPSAKSWPLYVTPELNKALVHQIKQYTR